MCEYEDMMTDKQYEGHLIDGYFFLSELLAIATEENAANTIKAIKRKITTNYPVSGYLSFFIIT